jgi:hypothetical protein
MFRNYWSRKEVLKVIVIPTLVLTLGVILLNLWLTGLIPIGQIIASVIILPTIIFLNETYDKWKNSSN